MWFTANLLFESVHDNNSCPGNLWEERIVLIQADSAARARLQAETLGKTEEHEYISATGDKVQWLFRRLERVYPIDVDTLENGTELFSRFLRTSEVESLLTPFPKEIAPVVVGSDPT